MKPSDDIKKEVYTGKDSQSVEEIAAETMFARSTVQRFAKEMVKAGKWKEVVRRGERGFVKAYIKVK